MKRGRITYVPKPVFEEINNIIIEENIDRHNKNSQAMAMNKMVEYSVMGRQFKKLTTLNLWGKK